MKTWTTIIIDDELLARQRLKRLLSTYPEIIVIGEADNGDSGKNIVNQLQPQLIFLDIEMPVLNGFQMLEHLEVNPKIVFVTAYDQYAIRAFEQNSIDYLLKPVEAERLEKTVSKLASISAGPDINQLNKLLESLKPKTVAKTITVKLGDRIMLIRFEDILYIQAEDKYVFIYTGDGKKLLTEYTIAGLEEKLPAEFVRIHRSCILNAEHIKEIRKGFNGALIFIMNNAAETQLSSSRSNADALRERFDL